MNSVVYVTSSPLHLFVALGLMCGPFRGARQAVAMINERPDRHDFLAEALRADPEGRVQVERFLVLNRYGPARQILGAITDWVRQQAPDVLAAGNDSKLEFYAALRGAPQARVAYLDDGLYSYLPIRDSQPAWWQRFANWRRSVKYGVQVRQGQYLGGADAVHEGWVLLPQRVHPALAAKKVHRLEASWFADPWLRGLCVRAAGSAGFDAGRCRGIGLVMLVPQLDLMQRSAALRERFERVAALHAARGELIAIKRHPRATGTDFGFRLDAPQAQWLEIPPRLPVEALVPLLAPGTRVVGALTTGLLTLALLGDRLEVRNITPPERGDDKAARFNNGAIEIYESVGIVPLGPEEGAPPAAARTGR